MFDRIGVRERETRSIFAPEESKVAARLLIVSDDFYVTTALESICDFLGLGVEQITSARDVVQMLKSFQPIAVIVAADAEGQDGFNVMMEVAAYDRDLPILLLTGDDPALMGAADAVEEIWKLTAVTKSPSLPKIGEVVDFLFKAGRRGEWFRATQL